MTMNAGEAARQRQQTKAFLAWCNSHLKKRGTALEDFVGDLASGIKLILLVEQLSGDKLGKYNKNPKIRIEKVENLNVALNYINSFLKEIGIKNQYSAESILDEEERMILGMVWTLILRYSVSEVSEGATTAKEGLLLWAQKKVQEVDPGRQVANFTTHWQDGCAFSALIAGARPDLLDYSIVKPNEKLENLNRVFDLAEEKLGIPKLLDANDMVTPALAPRHSARAIRRARTSAGNSAAQFAPTCPDAAPRPLPQVTMRPDEKSVMAYVAFFWKEFAANKRKNLAAERIGTVVAREQSFLQLQEQYTAQATELSQWLQEREAFFKKEAEGNSMGEVEKARRTPARLEHTERERRSRLPLPPLLTTPRFPPSVQALLDYLEYGKTEKPGRYQQQLDLEALASAIDARLATLNRTYTPADELGLPALQRWWEAVRMAERSYEDQLKGKLKSLKKVELLIKLFASKALKLEEWMEQKAVWVQVIGRRHRHLHLHLHLHLTSLAPLLQPDGRAHGGDQAAEDEP